MANDKKIILTGKNGFLGGQLYNDLKSKKFSIVTIGKKKCDINLNLINKKKTLEILNKFNSSDILIHCAGYVPKKYFQYNSKKLNNQNVKIANNISKSKINNIIFISSFTVYGNDEFSEEKKINSKLSANFYAKSKILSENKFLESKKKVIILRIPGIFGGNRKDGLIYQCIKSLLSSKKFAIKKYYAKWSCIHIKDISKSIIKILKNKNYWKKKIYNICYSEEISAQKIIKMIHKKFGKKIEINHHNYYKVPHNNLLIKDSRLSKRINDEILRIKRV